MTSYKTDMIKEIFDLARLISSTHSDDRLTLIQLRTVMFVAKKGIVKPTEIAKNFSITPASVTAQIDKLVRQGWLEREYNQDDKRVIEVTISNKGKEELPKEIESLEKNSEWIFKALNKEEKGKLLELVQKVNSSVAKK